MKPMKYCVLLLCLVQYSAILAGCWNYEDVEKRFVVTGIVIDRDPQTSQFIMDMEVSKAMGGPEAQIVTRIETVRGDTLLDAVRNSISLLGSKLYWGHTQIYVISERIAKEGIKDVLSILDYTHRLGSDIFLLICENESAMKIYEFEDPLHQHVSQHISDLLESYEFSGKYRKTHLYKIMQELASEEISIMLPYIRVLGKESDSEKKEGTLSSKRIDNKLIVDGSAIFSSDKMVERLNEIETRSALILKNELKDKYTLTLNQEGSIPKCTIQAITSVLKISPAFNDAGSLKTRIELKLEGNLGEILTQEDYITDRRIGELNSAFSGMLLEQFKTVLYKAQQNNSDIIGLSRITHIKQPTQWKNHSLNWDEIFMNAIFDINVKVNITRSSLYNKPVEVGS